MISTPPHRQFFLIPSTMRGAKLPPSARWERRGYFTYSIVTLADLIRRSQNLASIGTNSHGARWEGGATWSPMSFDPRLGYAIVSAAQHLRPEHGSAAAEQPAESLEKRWNSGYGTVSAVDVATGRIVWQDKFDQGLVGGSASTAGGITFVGEGNGYFDALDTKSGLRLWRFQTGAGVNAAPSVFQIGDRQYVAIASGGNQQFGTPLGDALFVFQSDGP